MKLISIIALAIAACRIAVAAESIIFPRASEQDSPAEIVRLGTASGVKCSGQSADGSARCSHCGTGNPLGTFDGTVRS